MAGRKHRLQDLGITPGQFDFNKEEDPFLRDLAFRSMSVTPFCKLCGREIIASAEGEAGEKADWEYEMQVSAHQRCINLERMRRMGEM